MAGSTQETDPAESEEDSIQPVLGVIIMVGLTTILTATIGANVIAMAQERGIVAAYIYHGKIVLPISLPCLAYLYYREALPWQLDDTTSDDTA